MKKYIKTDKRTTETLMKVFDVCERVVKNALKYRQNNELARKIRYEAIKRGGNAYGVELLSKCWFESDGRMCQEFVNGARIEVDKSSDTAVIFHRGRLVEKWGDVRLSTISEIQNRAAAL